MAYAAQLKMRRWLITRVPSSLHPLLKSLKWKVTIGMGGLLRRLPGTSATLGPPRRIFETLPDYVAARNRAKPGAATYTELYPSHTVKRALPSTIDPKVHAEFFREATRIMRAAGVATIDNGRVLTSTGTVIGAPDDFIFDVSDTSETDRSAAHPLFLSARLPRVTRIEGRVAVLTTHFASQNYSHWMFDLIPRLHLLRKSGLPYDKIVVPCRTPYQSESLQLLGIERAEMIDDLDLHIEASKLIVPSLPGLIANPQSWACRYLRDSFLKHVQGDRKRRRILISRDKAGVTRRVTNEGDVFGLLRKFGFERVFLEDLALLEQVQLFRDAEFVVSPHGAGLTNLVFCRQGSSIIELFSPNYVNVIYWSLANQVGLNYGYLRGLGGTDLAKRGRRVHEDITVDISQLKTLLDAMLGGVRATA
jgi:capsular polysaccharide biosynthesis protein